jgi:dTDP-4-amino-4,6-dideoxygalactose transaminase
VPIHLQEAYTELGLREGAFSNAEALARETLSLPMYPELTEEQVSAVTDTVRAFFASGRKR